MAENGSMYNTPPCYTIYMLGLVADWLLSIGGLEEMQGDFGLIRRMDSRGGMLLTSDPVLETLSLVRGGRQDVLREGGVQHGIFR